jgi:hypothetical protein
MEARTNKSAVVAASRSGRSSSRTVCGTPRGLTQFKGTPGTDLVKIRHRSESRRLRDAPDEYIFHPEHKCATMRQ